MNENSAKIQLLCLQIKTFIYKNISNDRNAPLKIKKLMKTHLCYKVPNTQDIINRWLHAFVMNYLSQDTTNSCTLYTHKIIENEIDMWFFFFLVANRIICDMKKHKTIMKRLPATFVTPTAPTSTDWPPWMTSTDALGIGLVHKCCNISLAWSLPN